MTNIEILNRTVWATIKPSPISGVGVFAIRDIPAGTILTTNNIIDLQKPKKVIRTTESEFKSLLPEIQEVILGRILFANKFVFYSPNDEACLQSFMNHSETPNSDGDKALISIAKGEEITLNYRTLDGFDNIHPLSKEANKFL